MTHKGWCVVKNQTNKQNIYLASMATTVRKWKYFLYESFQYVWFSGGKNNDSVNITYHHLPGLEVIKHEFILKLKTKRNDWMPADTCP